MSKHSIALRLMLLALLVGGGMLAVEPVPAAAQASESPTGRWIVQLQAPPLGQAPLTRPEFAALELPRQPNGKLQLDNAAAQRYRQNLQQQQQAAFQTIQQVVPGASLQRQYQVVFNGLAVALPNAASIDQLRALPEVAAVYPDAPHTLHLYSSNELIQAPALWDNPAIGGQANAGAGVKIAIIDSGIKIDNPFFDPAGYSYPAGYPLGDTAHTTPKVIVARNYIRPAAPPLPGSETPQPGPEDSSHGTHVAGIAGGNANTRATIAGLETTISGVAPRAYLMNYKTFYANTSPFSGSAFSIELIAALEDAVLDGADVINNSWGGRAGERPETNPIAQAAEAAVDAGVVVVFSAGNEGPDQHTAGSPAYSDKVISVGAATKPNAIAAGFVDVVEPEGVPEALQGRPFGVADFGPPLTESIGPAPYLHVAQAGNDGLACEPLAAGALAGQIALIERGACTFSLKVFHAQQAGASAAIVFNSETGGEGVINMAAGDQAEQVVIPSIFVPRSMGLGMINWSTDVGAAARVLIDISARFIDQTPDVLTSFSSRGPSFQATLKPDVIAPGAGILSAGFAAGEGLAPHLGFGLSSGTSMSGPHVAGGAALLRQVYPAWRTADVRSALMSTADRQLWLDDAQTIPASVLDQGAGRINLARAVNPGLLFDSPSVSFGNLTPTPGEPTSTAFAVRARNITSETLTYQLSAGADPGSNFALTATPATITLGPQELATITIAIEIPADQGPQDYGGLVRLVGGVQDVHIPVWARTLPAEPGSKVLLLDNDGSTSLGLRDYSGYYAEALFEQAIATTYIDLDELAGQEQTLPTLGELQRHEIIIWFTGDNFVPSGSLPVPVPLTPADQNLLIAYLQSGGNIIASGQNLADASDIDAFPPDPRYGRSDLYGYLGAQWAADNIFALDPTLPRQMTGLDTFPWSSGIVLDVSPLPEGTLPAPQTSAGNLDNIDALQLSDADPRVPDRYTRPFLRVPGTPAQLFVGMQSSDSPTLEKPLRGIPYRSTILGFGLEGIRNDLPGTTRRNAFLQQLLYWHIARPSVRLSSDGLVTTVTPNESVAWFAAPESNVPSTFLRYRWNFGDGSPIVETSDPNATHQYAEPGTYQARVEVTDSWGHRALSPVPAVVSGESAPPAPQQADQPAAPAAPTSSEPVTFAETGATLEGRFLEFWQQNGGLAVFGYPLADASDTTRLGQTFERTRFEYHPEQAAPYDVLLGRMGVELLEARGQNWRDFPTVDRAAAGCLYFAETRHSLCEPFKSYWESNGLEFDGQAGSSFAESLALFGLPLSEPMQETLADGSTMTVQWFERARFEHHPQNAAPHDVLLGLLGRELARE